MMAILTGPLALLCFYLAVICFRRNFKKQAYVIGGFAVFFFALTLIMVGAGYYTWASLDAGAI
ncbi:hypothetical protein SAMN02745165_01778 [Malonomonas rubra DSM 5091]|uniref:Uncharacterized protein n=1 Tax=Malonomonas rubra DSM 5091 TaxID=1122189 RepID=A0A1M6HC68_MALRU|nr:hypothetical protein [Malonomonas rubra]SHJ19744.1 hypothetical protein SAMN02745165_01778 [Malonomonas rubra DSM 5091]